jgi:uncharacterized membrane protein YphA (DoxX/SURF4 family)
MMNRLKTGVTWALQLLLGVVFVLLGTGKFMDPDWAGKFARWGFPPGIHLVIGALEALGGACLLVPSLASYAATGLMAIMAGAVLTHLVHGEMHRVMAPVPHFVLLAILALARRSSARRLPRASPA